MALKIRLKQHGRTNNLVYRIVVTDGRNPRDGKYVEAVGFYNPQDDDEGRHLVVKGDRVRHWLQQGAELTTKTEALIRQAAPDVIREYHERQLAKRNQARIKRRERRQKAAAA